MKFSMMCMTGVALAASVHAKEPESAADCEANYVKVTGKMGVTPIEEECQALTTYSKCLGQFEADVDAESFLSSQALALALFEQNAEACEPFWNTLDTPVLRTVRDDLEMTVDNARDIKFHRHRRQTVSVFDMNDKITKLSAAVESLTDALAAKSDELDQKNAALETKLSDAVDTAKESLEDSVDDLSDKVNQAKTDTAAALDQAKTDTAAALNQAKQDAATASAALEKKISGSVTDKLKPFEGTEVALNSLKTSYLSNPKIPVYRVARFHTYTPRGSWFDDNSANSFGGVNPSTWSNGNGRADQMNADFKYLQRIFTQTETANKWGANICSEAYNTYTSTGGLVCSALFRIKNTGTSTINWTPSVRMTSFQNWSERASISVNGNNRIGGRNCPNSCNVQEKLAIPANSQKDRVSTVIFVSTGGQDYTSNFRATVLLFRDNSLALPDGLEFVDDLDTVTGSWKK